MEISASRRIRCRFVRVLPTVALLLGGCGGSAVNPFHEAAHPSGLEISIENQGLLDVRVTLMSELGSEVLGVVGGDTNREVHIPWKRYDHVSFRLDPLVGTRYTTESIQTSPGDHIELIIPMELVHTVLRRR